MKSKLFLILLSVSIATAALGVAQAGAYEPPPSKTETPAATEPTNRNQSALEVDQQNSKDQTLSSSVKPMKDASATTNATGGQSLESYGVLGKTPTELQETRDSYEAEKGTIDADESSGVPKGDTSI